MTKSEICILISVVLYMALVLYVGFKCSRKNKSTDDFYLGGRKLGPIVTAMSAEASDMSGWLLMGLPGVALLTGLADAFWTAIGLAIGTWGNWFLIAKRIRNYSQKTQSVTLPNFFSDRYRDKSNVLMSVAAVVIIVFFVPYTASGFKACGTLFNALFGIDYHVALLISAAIIVLYTAIGGFLAASVTDLLQSIVMTVALAVIVIFGIVSAGGLGAVAENAGKFSEYVSLNASYNVFSGKSSSYGFLTVISTLAWGLGYFGMPHILLRFMAIDNPEKLKISRRVGTVWVVVAMGIAIFIGIIGYGMIENGALGGFFDGVESDGVAAKSETIIIEIANLLSKNGIIAALVAGVVMAGIFASTMSTSDSQLLAASSSISENILKPVFFKNMSKKTSMIVARLTVVAISVVSVFLAWNPNSSVFNIVSFAWAGFGASFGPLVIASLFWKRTNKWGALAGMLMGGVSVFVWKYLIRPLGGAFDIYELLPAFVLSAIAIVAVSLLTKKPDAEIVEEFESVKTM